jgi:hypothetical protein
VALFNDKRCSVRMDAGDSGGSGGAFCLLTGPEGWPGRRRGGHDGCARRFVAWVEDRFV